MYPKGLINKWINKQYGVSRAIVSHVARKKECENEKKNKAICVFVIKLSYVIWTHGNILH